MKTSSVIIEIEGVKFCRAEFDNDIEKNILYNVILERANYGDPNRDLAHWVNRVNSRRGKYPEKIEYLGVHENFTTFLLHHAGHVFLGVITPRDNILCKCGDYCFEENKLFCTFKPANFRDRIIDLFGEEVYEPQLYDYSY